MASELKKDMGQSLFVSSLAKGLKVFDAFAVGHRELGITEIAELTGLEKSATSRNVQTLHKLGYLSRDPRSRKYAISAKVLSSAYLYLKAHPVIEVAMPRLVGLGDETDLSVTLCMLDDTDIIYAVRLDRREFYHPTGHIGERQPAYCTSGGRAILSRLPRDVARDILERSNRRKITPHTKTGIDEIMEELKTISEKLYCLQAGEFIRNEINLAAPVINSGNEPVAAVVISRLYRKEQTTEIENELAPLLLQTVKEISSAIGARN
ncbi:MAG: IclR family transcriptional regulator [Pseudomonadota bacterium]